MDVLLLTNNFSYSQSDEIRLDDEKGYRKRRYLISRALAVPKKAGAEHPYTRTYERAAEHLKICFADMPLNSPRFWSDGQGFSSVDDPSPPGSVSLTTVKRLAWNNNLAFCTAVAAGGDSGLCRILILRGLENEQFAQIKSEMLSSASAMNGDHSSV